MGFAPTKSHIEARTKAVLLNSTKKATPLKPPESLINKGFDKKDTKK